MVLFLETLCHIEGFAKVTQFHRIYSMCAEGLSSIFRRNEDAGLLHGGVIARGRLLYHIFYLPTIAIFSLKPMGLKLM